MGFVTSNVRIIHYVVTHVLIPIKFNLGQVSKIDLVITWLLANKPVTNWARDTCSKVLEMETRVYHTMT